MLTEELYIFSRSLRSVIQFVCDVGVFLLNTYMDQVSFLPQRALDWGPDLQEKGKLIDIVGVLH